MYDSSVLGVRLSNANSKYFDMPNNSIPSGNTSYSLFFIFTSVTATSGRALLGGGNWNVGQYLALRTGNSGTGTLQTYWNGYDLQTSNTFSLNTKSQGATFYTSGSTRSVWVNFVQGASDTPGTRSQGVGSNYLGRTYAGEYWDGWIHEAIGYSNILTTAQRQDVEGYLAWKWGLTASLPSTHPYKNFPFIVTAEANPRSIPSNVFLVPINTYSTIKTFTLPVVSTNPGRLLVLKDYLGYAGSNNIRLSTIGLDRIERSGVSSMALSNAYGAWWFQNDGMTNWFLTSAYLNSLSIIQPTPPYFPGLWVKSYANTSQIPNSNGPATSSGSSSNWGALLTTTYNGNIFAGSNTPGASSYIYYGNNYGIAPSGNNNYSLIMSGLIYSAGGGTIQFRIVTDDGFRLDYNGANAINQWQQQGATTYTSATLSMPAGYTPIIMRWYDTGGGGAATMEYNMNGAGYTSNGTNVYFYAASNITQV
jgi:hypothetical protein